MYSLRLSKIAARCPKLTPTQLRVAALVSALLPSYEIARILFTTERTVEKVRTRIRKALAMNSQVSLAAFLISLEEKNESMAQMLFRISNVSFKSFLKFKFP